MNPVNSSNTGLVGIKTIRDFELNDKILFLRLDLNVPMEDGKITDDTRIRATLPTIQYALEKGAYIVISSHLGRPKSAKDKEFSLEPVAKHLAELMSIEVILVEEPEADAIKPLVMGLKGKKQVIMIENIRFFEGETKNDQGFAAQMAEFTDVYINDAFGASHRAHASIDALPKLIKNRGIGFLIEKEIQMLDRLLVKTEHPYIAVMGGSKVSDKIDVIENLMDKVDGFIIGGAMAYTFLKAQGLSVGTSLVEADKVNYAREMMARLEARGKSMHLPEDHIVAKEFKAESGEVTPGAAIPEGSMGLDIGPKTIEKYKSVISHAKTIFWNGPMGVFERPAFAKGSFAIAEALAKNTGLRIVGGGDSAAAAEASGFADKMTHISTGGGASLEYLQGDRLPGLEVVRNRKGTPT